MTLDVGLKLAESLASPIIDEISRPEQFILSLIIYLFSILERCIFGDCSISSMSRSLVRHCIVMESQRVRLHSRTMHNL